MFSTLWSVLKQRGLMLWQRLREQVKAWTMPAAQTVIVGGVNDLARRKTELVLENALLRQQLTVLARRSKRPTFNWQERLGMVLLASRLGTWRQALHILEPDTLLRWHRELFKRFWARKSKRKGGHHALAAEVIALIRRMASENRRWGAERIRGELRKLGWRVGKGTVLKYMHRTRPPSQSWKTFLHNQAEDMWACDFIQVSDVWFRSLFVFVIVELGSRHVVHMAMTRQPTDGWVAQQLCETTPFGQGPKHLIRDNDKKYGDHFAAVATGAHIHIIKTPYRAPKANAIYERFIGSVRRECLNHLLIRGERDLFRMMKAYVEYFNGYWPHQGLDQPIPWPNAEAIPPPTFGPVLTRPLLGGLHHHYYRAA